MLGKEDSYQKIFVNRSRSIADEKASEYLKKIELNDECTANDMLNWANHCPEIWLEIGFGTGDNMIYQIKNNPDVAMIGCDPFVEGALRFASKISKEPDQSIAERIKVACKSAGWIISKLPDASIDKVFVLFPDPWPKRRQNKRRIFSENFISELARIMKKDAVLRVASDNLEYMSEIIPLINDCDKFISVASPMMYPDDWPKTKYMKKAKNNCLAVEIVRR